MTTKYGRFPSGHLHGEPVLMLLVVDVHREVIHLSHPHEPVALEKPENRGNTDVNWKGQQNEWRVLDLMTVSLTRVASAGNCCHYRTPAHVRGWKIVLNF